MEAKVASTREQFTNLHQELIDGCREGDQKAQFQIYKLYYKAMFNISFSIVNNKMEAEDIMQEAFLSAFDKIGSYSGTVSFGAWLKKIVQNRSLDALSKKNKMIYEDIESFHCIPDTDISENEGPDPRIAKIMDRIRHLPEKYREVISLYLIEGYDHEEISQILSIPSSTSRSHFSRARHRLISEIQNVKIHKSA